jgi:hypothetical protein
MMMMPISLMNDEIRYYYGIVEGVFVVLVPALNLNSTLENEENNILRQFLALILSR